MRIEKDARHPRAAAHRLQSQNERQALLRVRKGVADAPELVLGAEGERAVYRFPQPTDTIISARVAAPLLGGARYEASSLEETYFFTRRGGCPCGAAQKPGDKGSLDTPCVRHSFRPLVTLADGSKVTLEEGHYLSDQHSGATEWGLFMLHASGALPPQMSPGRLELGSSAKFPFGLVPKTRLFNGGARSGPHAGYSWVMGFACDAPGPNATGADGDNRCLAAVWLCAKEGDDDNLYVNFQGHCDSTPARRAAYTATTAARTAPTRG